MNVDNVVFGTAGHIDHGKTTLIKALTGRSTDTLKEEIKRGISIDLGFTYFDLPSGRRAGIIDVPGHERFVKNMIAGAVGIDIVLITIAANEGIKPQTIEHLDILRFLDIKGAVIALTKADLADDIMTQLVLEEIEELKEERGGFLKQAQVVLVDSVSGRGLPQLVDLLDTLTTQVVDRNADAQVRMNVDRAFTLKGFGTVVTGTLGEGKINVGDELEVFPKKLMARVRNIQVHEKNVETAFAGQRTALNLANVKLEQIERGDVLARPDSLEASFFLDVKLSIVPHTSHKLSFWSRVRVYLGAMEVMARLVPLGTDEIVPGQSAYAQLRFEKMVVAKKGDLFILRTYSPMETIGGGVVLNANPDKHGRASAELVERLTIKELGNDEELVEDFVKNAPKGYATYREIEEFLDKRKETVEEYLNRLRQEGAIIKLFDNYYHITIIENEKEHVLQVLSQYHESYPLQKGMKKEELRTKTIFGAKEFDFFFQMMLDEKVIKWEDAKFVALANFTVSYDQRSTAILNELKDAIIQGGYMPPSVKVITKNNNKLFMSVLESHIPSDFIKLDKDTVMDRIHYEHALNALQEYVEKSGDISLGEFRDLIQTSRKYALLLLESFDKNKITKKIDDKRTLFTKR